MATAESSNQIAAVRRFSRFYTRQLGLLNETLLDSPFSLSEGRVLYELAQRDQVTATELSHELGLDAGYLSRILSKFQKHGLLTKTPATDARRNLLQLTAQGLAAFAVINTRSHQQIETFLNKLAIEDQARLVDAMRLIEALLSEQPEAQVPYLLRPQRPGDMGWVVQRHGLLYNQEYGWNEQFEALVAGIVAEFIQKFDPRRECCWIAERAGENVASAFVVQQSDTVAKLRLLLVEPKARGLGIGQRLVTECIRFARQAGYRKMTLWTNSVLVAARHLYEQQGFVLVASNPHHSFGHDLIGETWELTL